MSLSHYCRIHCFSLFLIFFISVVLLACDNPDTSQSNDLTITHASWDKETATLTVAGRSNGVSKIELIDDLANNLLASTNADVGAWQIKINGFVCQVTASQDDNKVSKNIENAPEECNTLKVKRSQSRALASPSIKAVADQDISPLAAWPEGLMLSPAQNMTIMTGQSVNFSAAASDTLRRTPINYYWDFGGAGPNSNAQNPGQIFFNVPGVFVIKLMVTNNLGISDPTPSTRVIIVQPATNAPGYSTPYPAPSPLPNTPVAVPVPLIMSPMSGNVTISVGESIDFIGSGFGPAIGPSSLRYFWDFGGAITSPVPSPTAKTPGRLSFLSAGTFIIRLNVQTNSGVSNIQAAQVVVTVLPGNVSNNLPPRGIISSPTTNVVIRPGDALFFSGDGFDPENNRPLRYFWDFGGTNEDSTQRVPGLIRFNNPGVYTVRFITADATGLADPNPPIRIITVQSTGNQGPTATQNQIISPAYDMTIQVGDYVTFSGQAATGLPEARLTPLQYFWNFDEAAPTSSLLNPGTITFTQAGIYNVSFVAGNTNGILVGQEVRRTITVIGSNLPPQIPQQSPILSPVGNDITINVGEQLNFIARPVTPSASYKVEYQWFFSDNIAPSTNRSNAGSVIFRHGGQYQVTLNVRIVDAFGNVLNRSRAVIIVRVIDNGLLAGGILSPANDIIISAGSEVSFQGDSLDSRQYQGIHYLWRFVRLSGFGNANLLPDLTVQNPGRVLFRNAGEFEVRFEVSGTHRRTGETLRIGGTRRIIVSQPGSFPTQPPIGGIGQLQANILSPQGNATIRVGSSLNFAGSSTGATTQTVSYYWDFGGASLNTSVQNPGTVTFSRVGSYRVTLNVRTSVGGFDSTPPSIRINVIP